MEEGKKKKKKKKKEANHLLALMMRNKTEARKLGSKKRRSEERGGEGNELVLPTRGSGGKEIKTGRDFGNEAQAEFKIRKRFRAKSGRATRNYQLGAPRRAL